MTKNGFNVIVEVGEYYHFDEDMREQRVVYYEEKIADGFDDKRVARAHNVSVR